MSVSNGTTDSALASEDWQLAPDEHRPLSLLFQLRRGVHGFPWIRLVHFEGDNNVVTMDFASHTVTVTGQGLAALLAAIAGQRVIRVIEPGENEASFGVRGPGAGRYQGPAIHSITVKKFGEDE
jgi:hypothetical protein